MLSFWLGVYYGCVLGFLSATCYRHWASLYEPRTFIHEEDQDIEKLPAEWRSPPLWQTPEHLRNMPVDRDGGP